MVEIIPKPVEKEPLWQSILFYVAIFLLIGAVLGFFVLEQIQKATKQELKRIEEALAEAKTPEEIELENEVLKSQKKINDFTKLFKKHLAPSNLFEILESLSHPRIQLTSLNFNVPSAKVEISGQTDSFQNLGQQLMIYRQAKELQGVNLSEITLGEEGKIKFTFELSFDPQLMK